MEERLARLEEKVEHIQADVSELKINVRRLDDKFDAKFDALKDLVTNLALSTEKRFARLES